MAQNKNDVNATRRSAPGRVGQGACLCCPGIGWGLESSEAHSLVCGWQPRPQRTVDQKALCFFSVCPGLPTTGQLGSEDGVPCMPYPWKSPSVHVIGKNKSDSILDLFLLL